MKCETQSLYYVQKYNKVRPVKRAPASCTEAWSREAVDPPLCNGVYFVQLDSRPIDDTVLEQLAMEARLRQTGARHRRQVAEQYVEHVVSFMTTCWFFRRRPTCIIRTNFF